MPFFMTAVQQAIDKSGDIAQVLLTHYDAHARTLPWRAPPGQGVANPYHVWLSEIMLQQTTVAAVGGYFQKFTQMWPDFAALAAADDADVMAAWAGLGYYARARNLLKCARVVVAEHDGRLPETEAALLKLPGSRIQAQPRILRQPRSRYWPRSVAQTSRLLGLRVQTKLRQLVLTMQPLQPELNMVGVQPCGLSVNHHRSRPR